MMKMSLFVVLTGLLLLTVGAATQPGLVPFLAVTGRPTEAEVCAKVAAIQAQGLDSFLVYARSGLEYAYMGEDWLRLCEWFCREAESRSMKVWLYDEYNWPSGTCKGRVPRENDAWRYRELGVFPDGKGGFRWAEAMAGADWVNVCEPAAIDRFMELTHKVYEKRLARWFANGTICGIFTDEPGHPTRVRYKEGTPPVSFRTYSGLEDEYRTTTGRELRADVERFLRDPSANGVWPAYAELMGRRFRAAYFDKLRAWCDKMGVSLTGHLIEENDPAGSVRYNGLPLQCLRGESLPGMDEIGTAYDPSGKASPKVEWTTFNLARQAILHRGNRGGFVELFACGPADLTPDVLRQLIWMAAFHGIDHYLTCMDVMDEKGLVDKHRYFSAAGPAHPWYAAHARLLADEARNAARFARKDVAEGEVAVRYPQRLAALAAHAKGRRPDLSPLLQALELNQFVCRLVDEDEPTDLPSVFVLSADGTYSEERSGRTGLTPKAALDLCRSLPRTFAVLETDGTPATDVMVRTASDGTSAVLNMRPFADRTLVAKQGDRQTTFRLPAQGVRTFAPGELPPSDPATGRTVPLADVDWALSFDRDNLLRVNFASDRTGRVEVAEGVAPLKAVTCTYATSCAVMESGRPLGATGPCRELPGVFAPLYRTAPPQTLSAGRHDFLITTGKPDPNYFLPALFLAGDFAVRAGRVEPPSGRVRFGSLAEAGFPNYVGRATWSAEVTAPDAEDACLCLDTGRCVTSVRFCGVELGVKVWGPFEWMIPPSLRGRRGLLEISIWTSVQPMFGDEKAGKWDVPFWFAVHAPGKPAGLYSADFGLHMRAAVPTAKTEKRLGWDDEKFTVGAIRWDAWYGDGDDEKTKTAQEAAAALSHPDHRWRLPFFADVGADGKVTVDGRKGDAMEREIDFAADHGIDYWAFLVYEKGLCLNNALPLYLKAKLITMLF